MKENELFEIIYKYMKEDCQSNIQRYSFNYFINYGINNIINNNNNIQLDCNKFKYVV